MKRFLTKEFTEKFYFPIESNNENLPVKDPAAQQSDLFRLLNISATKPLTPGANNEVIIRNIFDVFTGHASDMARLNAYGLGLLDYMKWLNYREKTANEKGQIKVRGVRKFMQQAYGDAAIVTMVVIAVFAVLALKGTITADNVMIIVSTVIAFYFGTQSKKV